MQEGPREEAWGDQLEWAEVQPMPREGGQTPRKTQEGSFHKGLKKSLERPRCLVSGEGMEQKQI